MKIVITAVFEVYPQEGHELDLNNADYYREQLEDAINDSDYRERFLRVTEVDVAFREAEHDQ